MPRSALYAGAAAALAAVSLVTASLRPSGEDAAALDGAALFVTKGCAGCHHGPGIPTEFGVGPPLGDAPEWAGDRVDGMSAEEYLAQSMREPSAFISPAWNGPSGPSDHMPLLRLTNAEIEAIVDYLLSPMS